MRLKKSSLLLCSLFLVCAQAKAQSMSPTALNECLEVSAATTAQTPGDLWGSIPACAQQDKHEQAAFMFGLAGSLGVFDAMRVKDVSARQAAKILPMAGIKAMGDEASQQFQRHIQQQFGDPAKRKALCSAYKSMPAPTYFPHYMINHGLAQLTDKSSNPLVDGFDAAQAWPQAIDVYMQCP